ncbi:hypothetical protein AHF37_03071 [Paragonimus kellicotti]|nr:hypothetical protein AHF37_03071 [Paragonimus kellicotti]
MSRMPTVISAGGAQTGMHMQTVHSSSMISGPLSIPNPLSSGVVHSVHGMPLSGLHERDHILAAQGSVPGHYFSAMGANPNSPHHVPNMLPHGHHQFHHPHPLLGLLTLDSETATMTMNMMRGIPATVVVEGRLTLEFSLDEFMRMRSWIFQIRAPQELIMRSMLSIQDCDSVWWEAFATDFFEDDATLTVGFLTEDGPKRYTIGRTLIPRYFRSIFDSGCGELHFNLRLSHEYFHHSSLTLDSETATMTMNMMRGIPATVVVEGRLTLEFSLDEFMRMRSWIFQIRAPQELIMRSMLSIQDPTFLDQLPKNITRYGMTPGTLNFFRLCVILEPMQELMSRQKAYSLSPRDCLKTTLFQKWQRMMPQEATRQPSKRRKRKGSAAANEGPNTNNNNNSGISTGRASKRKQSPVSIPSHHIAQPGDVMIVGEPTLMGGDFGDEDERLITRLENTQYDATVSSVSSSPHMHPSFSCSGEHPPGMISSPVGHVSISMNPGQPGLSGIPFRGSLPSGGPNSHLGMGPNEHMPNSLPSMPPHPSCMPVSMIPGQQSVSSSGRFGPHNAHVMVSPQYMSLPSKSSVSGATTPSSRDPYQSAMQSGPVDSMHIPVRSNSASSLLDGGPHLSGFSTCPSPNMLPSRTLAARFTPPGLPNGIVTNASVVSQANFMMPSEMVVCSNTSLASVQIPGTTMCSPPQPPASYTPDTLETSTMMHSSMQQAQSITSIKSSNSPLLFGCYGSNANGTSLPPDSSLSLMMVGSGCDPLQAVPMNENEDMKLPAAMSSHRSRSNSESGGSLMGLASFYV